MALGTDYMFPTMPHWFFRGYGKLKCMDKAYYEYVDIVLRGVCHSTSVVSLEAFLQDSE